MDEGALQKSIWRQKHNGSSIWGGQNKVLEDDEEEAIRQCCYEQWELGLGATRSMVFSAVQFLKEISDTGYKNNSIIMEYIDHLIKHIPIMETLAQFCCTARSSEPHILFLGFDATGLSALPPTPAEEIGSAAKDLKELSQKNDPQDWSSATVNRFRTVSKQSGVLLNKAALMSVEHSALQQKIRADVKRKHTSRRHVHKSGPRDTVASLREQMNLKDAGEKAVKLKIAEEALLLQP
ncbi:hypothetical protein BOTCAL_0154g00020 [Botryotinia calthae]|uniref:Uncharacterized protein n=1 Tax=Botryotinia calthae TaxID=38488 RepID=A0A4Y8D2N8_9HELO|nr:hypothetical protein BOTCAL_0154g00020 [Botryotinia calthae]